MTPPTHLRPTERQERAVLFITNVLDIAPPAQKSMDAYWRYIANHLKEASAVVERDARESNRPGPTETDAPKPRVHEEPISAADREILDTYHALSPERQLLAWNLIRALVETAREPEPANDTFAGPEEDLIF